MQCIPNDIFLASFWMQDENLNNFHAPIQGQNSGHMRSTNERPSFRSLTWSVLTNQYYQTWTTLMLQRREKGSNVWGQPMRGQYFGHVISINQWEASIIRPGPLWCSRGGRRAAWWWSAGRRSWWAAQRRCPGPRYTKLEYGVSSIFKIKSFHPKILYKDNLFVVHRF